MSVIKSHIQMPKRVLKNFHNSKKRFFYYDVKSPKYIGTNGYAISLNTQDDYYCQDVETFLSGKFETPFSEILDEISNIDLSCPVWSTDIKKNEIIINFCVNLMLRNPALKEKIGLSKNRLCKVEEENSLVVLIGSPIVKESILHNYFSTISINNTDIPFVLPVCGMYSVCCNDEIRILFPITPKIALTLFHKENINEHIEDNIMDYFSIEEENVIKRCNQKAFETQCGYNWGYIVCPEREELDRLKSWWDNEKNERQRN